MFVQIQERIESDIITGVYKTDDLIISTTQISKLYSVNPTTAVKAISKMTDAGELYKKPGIGMCVAQGAKDMITQRRKRAFLDETLTAVVEEARVLGISSDDLVRLIQERETQNND
jgi:DNA-binding transcriptional regulator YhcF (GntR family)